MKKFLISLMLTLTAAVSAGAQAFSGSVVTDEGAWCWFADPRALHYENVSGTINATYIGYIDVHGNVKATQYDWLTGRKADVLVRSFFQPDDHNNPTFLVLPDERVMIFYTRHTDEPKIWYRISRRPGDITSLGDEKSLTTANNTTYPSPFILSDDPTHIYLCWRGINWHPTIARLTMPDADDNCQFDFGPKQIVQSTGARPYAKYQSNGKDKIYLCYTTGHPDNEQPNWLYFNVVDINHGRGPILRDIKGKRLKAIADGVFNVDKTESYAKAYPYTVVDSTAGIRNWVWQFTLDAHEKPVIAFIHIDEAKTSHDYWLGRWTGKKWLRTWVQHAGHAFHHNWNSTERCYTGGMAIDPENVADLYLSLPTTNGAYDKNGVNEIWKYTIADDGSVTNAEQITKNSAKSNARPFMIPGSKNSPMRLAWMNGDYYYWLVQKNYPKGYPTGIRADYAWRETPTVQHVPEAVPTATSLSAGQTLSIAFAMNQTDYTGTLLNWGKTTYSIGSDMYPVFTIDGRSYRSQNRLLTSDAWATGSTGTRGDNHPTKFTTWVLTMTYDGQRLTIYRNGLIDQVIEETDLGGDISYSDPQTAQKYSSTAIDEDIFYACASPFTVSQIVRKVESRVQSKLFDRALPSKDDVVRILNSVNKTWQQRNATHGDHFWNRAVYHIGNMDAYDVTHDQQYLDFSTAWAVHNDWKGAKGTDRSQWKYKYGETPDHVLFGDNQVCFQIYADLYNLDPAHDAAKIARAREVMEYEMSTPYEGYLWWVDGLFMVMPVMTKLYNITGDQQYLDKMYTYWRWYTDRMYDTDENLYYRDAKYVYPRHKTRAGKKDFWARGDGWIFATFARVLQELPATDSHRDEYIDIYRRMAAALKACQQPDGYWERSLLDPAQARGYETSGTALFAYGYAWGIRTGILDKAEYGHTLNLAWQYLANVACQQDGTVGYIQPIGSAAIPGQVVGPTDYHDFGVGTFLMAAAEMSRLVGDRD